MNLKIVNRKKFLRSIIIISLLIIAIIFMISNKSFSHTENKYKTICISSGDTLWSIAKEEKENNAYYEDEDIRNIVDDIKKVNYMTNSDLKINQELKIREL